MHQTHQGHVLLSVSDSVKLLSLLPAACLWGYSPNKPSMHRLDVSSNQRRLSNDIQSAEQCDLQGVLEAKDGELEALRERLAEAKAVTSSKAMELAEARQLVADRFPL